VTADTTPTRADEAVPYSTAEPAPRPKIWPAVLLVGIYWAYVGISTMLDMPTFPKFMSQAGVLLLVIIGFLIWWLLNRRIRGTDRLLVLGCAVAAPVVADFLADETLGPITVMSGIPVMITAWAAWLLLARNASRPVWRGGLIAVLFLSAASFDLFRMEGLKGEGQADLHWRWSTRPEELYLARRQESAPSSSQPTTRTAGPLTLRPGDWPGFRGPNRDSIVRGVTTSTDWSSSPPKELWRRRVGPAWSSMAIVDGKLFTQEQRGENEAVVCLDAGTGSELWAHEEPGRFTEALSSLGPRATPTFSDGRIYAQGAAGTLVCLDASTGTKVWSRDVLADCDGRMPDWGVSSSPVVTAGRVIVFGDGRGSKKGLLGYHADSGEVAWEVDAGQYSYSSPHLATIAGREQVLFIGNDGLVAVDPATGATAWKYAASGQPPRSLQPTPVADNQLLVPLGMEVATDMLDVSHSGDAVVATKRWSSRNLKPSFNDFVVHDGYIYGFDQSLFTCVELKTGNRKWKQGRYGTGQVLLLADQALLAVVSDKGQVVLLAAKPDAFEERGEFQAVNGKTWNHPAIAQDRLYVRNAQEMACFDLHGK
jgi:outer membrane protein assembly factor BamB